MRFTQRLEGEVLSALRTSPDACITFPEAMYRPDGSIMVHRQNRSFRLHRYLASQLGIEVERGTYMHPRCKTKGCMNPMHRTTSRRSSVGRNATACPNGHRYTTATTLSEGRYRCKTCRDLRNARRRTGPRPYGYCRREGHRLSDDNVYVSTDVRGQQHRRCKKCTLARMKERNEARHV